VTTVSVVTPSGTGGADVELPGEIFAAKVNIPLMHQVVVAQEAAARQGTHATKTRGDVRGGGKKPYRQKGTGRARQGSLRAPQYAGGGVVHGPVPRSYAQRTPKKMKAAALRGALSDRTSHGRLAVVSVFVEGDEPSTAQALAVLRAAVGAADARLSRPVLVVLTAGDTVSRKSLRNVPEARVLDSGQLNTYDVLACDHVVFTQGALAEFVARTGGELVTVEKPAAKPARPAKAAKPATEEGDEPAAKPAKAAKPAAGEGDEPAAKPARATKPKPAAGDGDEPAAKPARAAKAKATDEDGEEPPAKPPRAARAKAADEDGEEPEAKPARAAASRARRPATAEAAEPAGEADGDQARSSVKQRSSGTSRKAASTGTVAEEKQEEDEQE
jgi:large subunit ribosomal protein L4